MNVLHLLATGGTGGIETLCREYAEESQHRNIFLFIWKGGSTAEALKAAGKEVIVLNSNFQKTVNTFFSILKICKRSKIDVVIVQHASPISHVYAVLLRKMNKNLKIIAYAHGNAADMGGFENDKHARLKKAAIKLSLDNADRVIAISNSVKNSLISRFGTDKKKIDIVYNGVDLKKFKKNEIKNSFCKLIYVGRLIEQKGVQNTIEVLAQLPLHDKFHFNIIGDGYYRNTLEALVEKYDLRPSVTFWGTQKNVSEFLSEADIFIHLPEWEEGFGITIVEAMAAGLLVICRNTGAISEVVNNSVDGIVLSRDGFREELPQILLNIEHNPEKYVQVRKEAVKSAEKFSIEEYAKKMDSIVSKCRKS